MRIALVGPVYPYRGGIAHYTTELAQSLEAQGHDVLLISFKRQYPSWLYPGSSDKDPSKTAAAPQNAKYWIDSMNPWTWFQAFRRIRAFNPDRWVLQWWTIFWAPVWVIFGVLNRLALRSPLIFICHNVQPHEERRGVRIFSRLALRLGDVCVVHSEEEGRCVRELVPGARVRVQHLPVFGRFAGEGQSQAAARASLHLPSQAPVFLFFGIIRSYKGLKDLLAAFPAVRRDLPDALLVVAGEFWEQRQDYEQLIGELALGEAVRIDDGYIPDEDLHQYLAAADLVVAPYRSVTGSAVVQTARGFGIPVIATRIGSLVELAQDDDGITLVEPGDPSALAQAMVAEYQGMKAGAGLRGRPQRSGWHAIVTAIEECYGDRQCEGGMDT